MLTSDFLSWLRKTNDLTLSELGQRVGVTGQYIGRLESGSKRINRDIERRIISAFNLDYERLVRLKEIYQEIRIA